jgi:hypothetical protein
MRGYLNGFQLAKISPTKYSADEKVVSQREVLTEIMGVLIDIS